MNLKVLLVDDDRKLLSIMSEHFEIMFGAECLLATDGSEGLKIFFKEEQNIDIVFTDMVMSGDIGTRELCARIKKKRPDLPIIVMSGYYFPHSRFSIRADRVLEKPFSLVKLSDTVWEFLQRRDIPSSLKTDKPATINTIDDIIDQLMKKKNQAGRRTVDYLSYGDKHRVPLNTMVTSIDNLVNLYSRVLPTQDISRRRIETLLIKRLYYCQLLLNLYKAIFSRVRPKRLSFNVNNSLEKVTNIVFDRCLDNTIVLIDKSLDAYIESDCDILEQCLFCVFKNIRDFASGDDSYLKLSSDKTNGGRLQIKLGLGFEEITLDDNHNKRITIVDDDHHFSNALKELLQKEGYDVTLYGSGYDFFDHYQASPRRDVDLIMLDIVMKGMTGLEVVEMFRSWRKYSHIPIIVISGYMHVLTDEFRQLLDDFQPVKPFYKDPSKLCDLLGLVKDLFNNKYDRFSFQSLFDLDLEQSIKADHILKFGFFPIKQLVKSAGWNITFFNENEAILAVLELDGKGNTSDVEDKELKTTVKTYYLGQLNDFVRHEVKNKLGSFQYGIKQVSDMLRYETRTSVRNRDMTEREISRILRSLEELKDTEI